MPNIKKMKHSELRQLCIQKGFDAEALRNLHRADFMVMLENAESGTDRLQVEEVADGGSDGGSDEHVIVSANSGDRTSDDLGKGDSENIRVLKLQLQLEKEKRLAERERFEMEKERLQLRSELNINQSGTGDLHAQSQREFKGVLPNMQGDDVLGFFNAFERVLEMHDVDRSLWSKLLLAHLSPKASRVYS